MSARVKKKKLPSIGHFMHHLAHPEKRGRHLLVISPASELRITVGFDLTIDENLDPVSDATVGDIQQEARRILEEGAREIVVTAQDLAPYRTGALMASIYANVEDVTGLIVGASVPYAIYQEYGTERIPPHPFLQPAINENQPMIQEDIDQMIADTLSQDISEDNPEFEIETETG